MAGRMKLRRFLKSNGYLVKFLRVNKIYQFKSWFSFDSTKSVRHTLALNVYEKMCCVFQQSIHVSNLAKSIVQLHGTIFILFYSNTSYFDLCIM